MIETFVSRTIETICAEVDWIGIARAPGQRRVEQHVVSAVNAVPRRGTVAATSETPTVVRSGCGGVSLRIPNGAVLRAEVGVIHGHIGRVDGVLIDQTKTAIAKVGSRPRAAGIAELSAIVLTAANSEVGVCRMERQTLKLRNIQLGRVAAGPGRS